MRCLGVLLLHSAAHHPQSHAPAPHRPLTAHTTNPLLSLTSLTAHQECYQALASHDAMALCPSCMRCTLAPAHRARMWRDVDALVAAHPMPPEHAGKRVGVLCNDCSATSEAAFHFIGNKCGACGGYNTRVVG